MSEQKSPSTKESLGQAIETHEKMLAEAVKSSEILLSYAKNKDFKRLQAETENRNRLVNILTYIQERIEKSIKVIPPTVFNEEISSIISDWQTSIARNVEVVSRIDQELLDILTKEKEETSKEIAENHRNKVGHQGYNLKNVKR